MSDSKFYNKIKACMTSKKQDWKTPTKLMNELDNEFHFNFDPCPTNPTFDGLSIEWKSRNYINPPYNQKDKWIKKAYEEFKKGKLCVMLLPSRTDTKAFHTYIYKQPGIEIRFIKGRLCFDDKSPAPFPSMIIIMKP